VAQGSARALCAGALAFTACEAFLDGGDAVHIAHVSLARLGDWAAGEGGVAEAAVAALLGRLTAPRPAFAGLALDVPGIAGILNVTPDSFHDGGVYAATGAAVEHGAAMVAAGADIIDVGGESSRPGALPVAAAAERDRVLPVVEALATADALVSIDTSRAAVMRAAIGAGAAIVNDITALTGDPDALGAVAESGASVVLMHMRGEPATMQRDPQYGHVAYEVYRTLEARVQACEAAGIPRARIAVDPGIGFGKTPAHCLDLLGSLALLHGLGCVVMAGSSRKSFLTHLKPDRGPRDRLPGSLAAAVGAAGQGVQLHRVHDVAETRQALANWAADVTAV
jgi:dihydropteroate synthase